MSGNVENAAVQREAPKPAVRPPQRWVGRGGLALAFILVVGAAFVGGRLLAQQDVPGVSEGVLLEAPAELPKGPPVANGFVQKVDGKTITIEEPTGGGGVVFSGNGGVTDKRGEFRQTEVVITQDTKMYREIPIKPEEMRRGEQRRLQVQTVTLADVRPSDSINVWGNRSGERVTAEVVYILGLLGQP